MGIKIFITGTDTDIGKTVVTSFIADYLHGQGINCGYLKLVSCGGLACGDCQYVQSHAGVPVRNVYHFPLPASPHLAAEQDGQEINIQTLDQAMTDMANLHDVVLVEGAGGLLVPLTRSLLLGDYLAAHDVQTVMVARSGLGTLNHTLLTLEGMRQRDMALLGVIFNDEQVYSDHDLLVLDNQRTIAAYSDLPVLGRVDRFSSWSDGQQPFIPIGQNLLTRLGL